MAAPLVTTDTSVLFTVVSDGYLDEPGATIEFSTFTMEDGSTGLQQFALGDTRYIGFAIGFNTLLVFPTAPTWQQQAENLRQAMSRYGQNQGAL